MACNLAMHSLQLLHDLLHLWNRLGRTRSSQKLVVVPLRILFEDVALLGLSSVWIGLDDTLLLGLHETIKVVTIRLFIVLHPQEIVECKLCKGDGLVHGIQIVWAHGRDELTNQMETLGVGESGTLISVNLSRFVSKVVRLGAKRSDFLGVLHPLRKERVGEL